MKKILGLIAVIVLLTSCVEKKKYDAEVKKVDSLTAVCKAMQKELDGYRFSPAKLLVAVRESYTAKEYTALENNYKMLHRYHPDSEEYATAKGIYEQSRKDQEAARKKAEAEAARLEMERKAKMKPVERIMERLGCDYGTATLINEGRVRIGMTDEQCREAWGSPRDINRSVGSYGVHEQWCYNGSYLYFENGVLTSYQN